MKKLARTAGVLLCSVMLSAAHGQQSQTAGKPAGSPRAAAATRLDAAGMQQIAESWRSAYNRGDAAQVAALYTEGGYYLSAHVLAHGRDAIRAYFQRGIDAGGHVDAIQILASDSSGDLAYCAGTYEATNAGQKVKGRILIIAKRVAGKWLIAAHEVVVADQP